MAAATCGACTQEKNFYLVVGNTVESFTLSGFEKIDDIVLGSIEPAALD